MNERIKDELHKLAKLKEEIHLLERKISSEDDGGIWNTYFDMYCDYFHKNNVVYVDPTYDPEGLSKWYETAKKQYDLYIRCKGVDFNEYDEDEFLTREQFKKLNMAFNMKKLPWYTGYIQLEGYVDKNNHSLVPPHEKTVSNIYEDLPDNQQQELENLDLGPWVHRQRDRYFRGIMSQTEFKLLTMLNFLVNTKLEHNLYCSSDRASLRSLAGQDHQYSSYHNNWDLLMEIFSPDENVFYGRIEKDPKLIGIYNWFRFETNAQRSQELVSRIVQGNEFLRAIKLKLHNYGSKAIINKHLKDANSYIKQAQEELKIIKPIMSTTSIKLRKDPKKEILNFYNDKYYLKRITSWLKDYKQK